MLVRIAAVAVVCATSAFAQAPRDSTVADSARRLRPVEITGSRAAGTIGGVSAVVITPAELRSSPAPLLEEALRESPFVHVRQNSRGEMELSVRGSDSRQAAVLLDGVPLSLGWDHRTDPSIVPITGAQELVIVRGLGSVLTGPNALGGTIEVSHDNAFGRPVSGGVWGGAGIDEHAAYVASLGAGRQFAGVFQGTLSLRGGVAHRERDGFALAGGASDPTAARGLRTNSDLRVTDGFLTARWNGALGRALGVTVTGFNAERGVPPEEHLTDPRLWRYPYQARAVVALSGNAGAVRTPFGFGTLELGAGYNGGRLRIESFSDRSYLNATAAELGDERTISSRALFTHTLPRDARLKAAVTLADVHYAETLPADTAVEYAQRLWSTGAEVELPLAPATALSAGVVYDRSVTPLTGGRAPQPPLDNIGFRAGMTHDISAEWRLHASGSRRSRFPSLRELYSGALDRFLPNPDLAPETLLGLEAGFTVDRRIGPIPDARLQLNLFHHDLRDAVARTTLPAPDDRFFRVNRDRVRTNGAEILAGVAFGEQRARSITITGDALIQHVVVTDPTAAGRPARHVENSPDRRGMVEVGVPFPVGIRAFVNARYTGRQYCLNADTGGEMRLAARTESSLAAERRFAIARGGAIRGIRVLAALDNAMNAVIFDQCGLPQPGRTLRLMVTIQ
ncbi:MAG: TonB-dependent receptor [Gemmatimonadaceae bacterium]